MDIELTEGIVLAARDVRQWLSKTSMVSIEVHDWIINGQNWRPDIADKQSGRITNSVDNVSDGGPQQFGQCEKG